MRMVRWAMGVTMLEHRRKEEILEEAKVEPIATVMWRRRLAWFGHVKRRDETENIRTVTEMKMEGKRPRGRPKLLWNDTVRKDLKALKIKEEWATDRERWKGLCRTRYPEQGDDGERWERKVRNWCGWHCSMESSPRVSIFHLLEGLFMCGNAQVMGEQETPCVGMNWLVICILHWTAEGQGRCLLSGC